MRFNYNEEFLKFTEKWVAEEKLMRENCMSEKAISELYRVSLDEFTQNNRRGECGAENRRQAFCSI